MFRLIVSPNVFIWTCGMEGLVYDSSSCTGFKFMNIGAIADITERLNNIDNLYSVEIRSLDCIDDSLLLEFLDKMINSSYAKIIDDNGNEPLSLKPILKIQDDRDYYIWLNRQEADGEIIDNLHNIIINVGSDNGVDLFAHQTLYPSKSSNSEIRIANIVRFIEEAKASQCLSEISIVGSPQNKITTNDLNRIGSVAPIVFYVPHQDILNNPQYILELMSHGKLNVLVRLNSCSLVQLKSIIDSKINFSLIIETENDLATIRKIISIYPDLYYKIIPVYNGINSSFIRPLISISEEELLSNGPNKKEIFIRQSINLFDFGKLYILPDGEIRTNMLDFSRKFTVSSPPIDIVFQEITTGNAWLRTRDFTPCCQCIYKFMCPSPSNYERIMNQTLCFRPTVLSPIK